MGQCSPVRRTVSQWSAPCNPAHVNLHAIYTHAMGCQGQSCRLLCPWGQGHRGVENPRLFKDRPTDGKRSGCAAPFLNISVFHSAGIRMQITDCFASRSGMVLRIILLSLWSIIPRRNPYIISAAPALPSTQCPSQNNRIKFMGNQCSLIRRTVSQSRNIPSTKNSHKSHATYAAPSEGRSLNSRGFSNPRILA